MLKAGDKAPDFILENDEGKKVSLEDFKGKKLILYFYPKDNTPGCTQEAIEFSLLKDKFSDLNTVVVGVNSGDLASHQNFKSKHNLKVMLLTDPENKTAEAYGAWGEKKNYGKTYMGIIRSTFVIENGTVQDAMYNVKAGGHAERVFNKIS